MSAFDGQNLFDTGPHRFHIGGLTLRHAVQESPQSQGVQLLARGRSARTITQEGTLLADDAPTLHILAVAIESKIDGLPHALIDAQEQCWPHTVMLQFDPGPVRRAGTRFAVDYRIQYIQVIP